MDYEVLARCKSTMNYELIDKYPFYVEPFHVDFTGRIFLGVLGNHLLNAAGNHSQKRGWGIGALNKTQHTWVLSRLSIEMSEMPRQYEHCEVRTWVESVMKFFTNRNFSIYNADGKPLSGGTEHLPNRGSRTLPFPRAATCPHHQYLLQRC